MGGQGEENGQEEAKVEGEKQSKGKATRYRRRG